MKNDLLEKLINKINFDYADNFELAVAKEYSFVPISAQNESFFVAVPPEADKEQIIAYVSPLVEKKVEFIFLSNQNFDTLFDSFLLKFSSRYGSVVSEGNSISSVGILPMGASPVEPTVEETFAEPVGETPDIEDTKEDFLNLSDDINLDMSDINDINISEDLSTNAPSDNALDAMFDIPIPLSMQSVPVAQFPEVVQQPVVEIQNDVVNNEVMPDITTAEQINEVENNEHTQQVEPVQSASAPEVQKEADEQKVAEAPQEKKCVQENNDDRPPRRIGEILIEEGFISEKQLTMALAEAKVLGIPLGSVLVKLGFITIKQLKEALGIQMGVKLATSEQLRALPTATSILPEDFVRSNKVIPLSMTDKSLVVGMVDPGDSKSINEIVYQTGLKPTVIMVTHYEYEAFLQNYYESEKAAADKILKQIESEKNETNNEASLWDQVESEIQDTSGTVAKFANKIVTLAIDQQASDIHIEPRLEGYVVRFRVDGTLKEVLRIPAKVDSSVVSRFKVLARMNIAEHRRPQDGNFSIKYRKSQFDFRVNTLPVGNKEKMVIRVLAPAVTDTEETKVIEIEGLSADDLRKIQYLTSAPNGIVLTSGPTGSGKTTTLYALIRALNSVDVNITTIEDPVEIRMDGVNQSAVNSKAGITFANSLRAILRQDPDIVLVGEIRDFETLEVAISASLTGHLVLSTVHTNSAAATITRLIEMGAKDYLVSSTVTGVIAQRLVKKLCKECKQEYTPTEEEARSILVDPVEIQNLTNAKIYKAVGCQYCNDTGYSGRTGIFEIMLINKDIKMMIAQRAHDVELEEYAVKHGMKTLKMSCIEHIYNGVTTVEEFIRILGLANQ